MATTQVTVGTSWTLLGTRTGTAEVPGSIVVQNIGAFMLASDSDEGETTIGQPLVAGTPEAPGGVLTDSGPGPVSWYGVVASGTGLAAVTVLDS